jgi:hypothetical protein
MVADAPLLASIFINGIFTQLPHFSYACCAVFTLSLTPRTCSPCFLSYLYSYAEVRSPGFLHFYKDKKAASDALARSKDPSKSSDPNCQVINLTTVNEFTIPDRKNKDNNCVDLDIGSESLRIK